MQKKLTENDFADLFGVMTHELGDACRSFIGDTDFSYDTLGKKHHDDIVLQVIKKLDSGEFDVSGESKQKKWESGWRENLDAFIKSGHDVNTLVPKYVHPDQTLRLYQEYIKPHSSSYEMDFFTALRLWLFNEYLSGVGTIYEFGCGTGYNLVMLANMFPDKKFVGLDWAKSAVELVNLIGITQKKNIHGRLFNMYAPDSSLRLTKDSAVLTIGALEQMGKDFAPFLDFIIKNKPQICINIEPLDEMYHDGNLLDYLAIKYHKQRNYLTGFKSYMDGLFCKNIIEIIQTRRMHFGSLYHDGWSILIWRLL